MSSEQNPIPDATFKKLQLHYQESIPEKIATLRQLITQFQNLQDLETLNSLRNAVHKIAGSAGTYGYSEVSVICKEFEGDLILKIIAFSTVTPCLEWIVDFENYLNKITQGFINGTS